MTEHSLIDRSRRRSLGFLDCDQETWSCFLVTFVGRHGQWHGHLAFRPQDSDGESDEVRTADIFIEASDDELRKAFAGTEEDLDALAAGGKAAADRAIAEVTGAASVEDLHRGLGALIQMLRRSKRLSVDELAENARIAASELRRIEHDPKFDPSPRTIFQLEQYFNLNERSLVILSGAMHVDNNIREEAVRFAASSEDIQELTKEERKLLNHFVKFLSKHTD